MFGLSGKEKFLKAVKRGNCQIIKEMITNGFDPHFRTFSRFTPLMWAIKHKQTTMASFLISNGFDINFRDPDDGGTALDWVCTINDKDGLNLLLKEGATPDVKHQRDGSTSLIHASQKGYVDIVKLLIENGADVDWIAAENTTALLVASEKGHVEIVRILLKVSNKLIDLPNKRHDLSPIGKAATFGHVEIVKLLAKHGAKIDSKLNFNSVTPLCLAVEFGHLDVVNALIKLGANVNVTTAKGMMPLMFAASSGNVVIGRALIAAGADTKAQTTTGLTAKDIAKKSNHFEFINFLQEI